jgi:uncharacterized ferredoxin-like protein
MMRRKEKRKGEKRRQQHIKLTIKCRLYALLGRNIRYSDCIIIMDCRTLKFRILDLAILSFKACFLLAESDIDLELFVRPNVRVLASIVSCNSFEL